MKIKLSELRVLIRQQINEALTPANKLALRFLDFYKAYDERDFDKAVRDFVDYDNEKMIPWEDENTGERGMMQRGKSKSARTTPEKVLDAHLTYGGRIPKSSHWASFRPAPAAPARIPASSRGRSGQKTLTTHEPRSGRRQTTNASIPSAGLTVGASTARQAHEPGFIRDADMKNDLYAAIEGLGTDAYSLGDDYEAIAENALWHLDADPQSWVHALMPQERTKVLRQMTMMAREIFG